MKVVLFLALLACSAFAANWAVLISGSNGFWNYRHQADVCHAYKTLLEKGFSAERIITLSWDDAATASQNPYPGKLFNKPTKGPGVDVRAGCVIDYSGKDVTPAVFLSVLRGDLKGVKGKGNGRVLNSTAADNVFLNFADHGAVGLIAIGSSYLYAKDLLAAFSYMNENKMYKKLVFYLEACESGSMFQQLPTNISIYAVSAASPDESSWGYYCSPDDKVNGKAIGSCLGDLFSISWMEDTDAADITSRTLQEQYIAVRDLTTKSKVMQWGDVTFTKEPVANYIGNLSTTRMSRFAGKISKYFKSQPRRDYSAVNSRDIYLHYLADQFKRNSSVENFEALQAEFASMQALKARFNGLKQRLGLTGANVLNVNQDCLKNAVEAYENACGKLSEHGLMYVRYLAEYCNTANTVGNAFYAPIVQSCTVA